MAYVDRARVAQNSLGARIAALLARFNEDRARRALFARTVQELNALSNRDLADLGISRLQIEDVAREAAFGK